MKKIIKYRDYKKNKINENGITLIVLIITVIVMLILAGFTLNMVLNDGGLLSKSKESVNTVDTSTEKEELSIMIEQALNNNLTKGYGSILTSDELYTAAKDVVGYEDDGETLKVAIHKMQSESKFEITFRESLRKYTIDVDGTIDENYKEVSESEIIDDF